MEGRGEVLINHLREEILVQTHLFGYALLELLRHISMGFNVKLKLVQYRGDCLLAILALLARLLLCFVLKEREKERGLFSAQIVRLSRIPNIHPLSY